jgi:hypothetical protein
MRSPFEMPLAQACAGHRHRASERGVEGLAGRDYENCTSANTSPAQVLSRCAFRLERRVGALRLQNRCKSRSIYDAGWSSLVARRAHNPEVVGSNPTPATKPHSS